MPTISVIVPVFNTADTIKRCIDSITSQTYTDFELINYQCHPAIKAPVGMNSRAQRYKKVVKGPQYESKI